MTYNWRKFIDPKHNSLQVHWHPSNNEIISKYDVLQVLVVYMISTFLLNVRKMGSTYNLLYLKKDVCGARYVINEILILDSLNVKKF